MNAVGNNRPGLLSELFPRADMADEEARLTRQIGQRVHLINVSGSLLNQSMQMFGRKVGLAFHYLSTGTIVPKTGGIWVRWFSSYEKIIGNFPEKLVRDFGEPRFLAQGKKRVDDQFSYLMHPINQAEGGMYAIFFTFSFSLFTFVFRDASQFDIPEAVIHPPFG
jgi:hypothetical protein